MPKEKDEDITRLKAALLIIPLNPLIQSLIKSLSLKVGICHPVKMQKTVAHVIVCSDGVLFDEVMGYMTISHLKNLTTTKILLGTSLKA